MDIDYALDRIKALKGTKFDEEVVNALETAINVGKLRLSAVEVQV
jgi:HD-GYP domain-containing protein (c-di-GMP phosphodiesterase class II)